MSAQRAARQQDHHYETLTVSTHPSSDHILHIQLNRPQKRNALNSICWKELHHAFSIAGTNNCDHRVILLTGSGPSFCSGIDTSDISLFPSISNTDDDVDTARRILSFRPFIKSLQDAVSSLESCPLPVVTAIHSHCIGAGVDIICAADIRLCSSDAIFSVREVKLGLAADVGTLQRLPKIVGNESVVRELCFTGRNFGAEEALKLGLVSRIVVDLEVEALSICTEIARNSPVAVALTKESLVYSRDCGVQEGLRHIRDINGGCLQTEDLGKGKGDKFNSLLPHSRL